MTTRWVLYRLIPKITLMAVLIGFALLLYTESGLRWLWHVAEPRLPPGIQIGSVQGRLLDKFTVKNLRIDTPELKLSVETAWLQWRPSALFGFALHVDEIVVIGLDGQVMPGQGEAEASSSGGLPDRLPRLPTIEVESVRVRNIRWRDEHGNVVVDIPSGHLSARIAPEGVRASVEALEVAGVGRFGLALEGRLRAQRIDLTRLDLDGPRGLRIGADGACDWPSLQCRVNWNHENLGWPLNAAQWISPLGEIEFDGSPDAYAVRSTVKVTGPQLPVQTLKAEVRGGRQGLDQFELTADSEAGVLRANGSMSWSQGVALTAELALSEYDLGSFAPEWKSRLNGGGAVDVRYDDKLAVTAPEFRLTGSLREQPFDLRVNAATADDVVDVRALDLSWADTQAHGAFRINDVISGTLQLTAPVLAKLDRRARGSLSADVTVSGKTRSPQLSGTLTGTGVGFEETQAAEVGGQFDLHWRRGGTSRAVVKARGIEAGGQVLDDAQIDLSGTFDAFSLALTATAPGASVSTRVQGSLDPQTYRTRVSVDALEAEHELVGRWSLQAPARLEHAGERTALTGLCLGQDGEKVCAEAQVDGRTLAGHLSVTPIGLERFAALWPTNVQVHGAVALTAEIPPSPVDNPSADIHLALAPTSVDTVRRRDSVRLLRLDEGEIRAQLRDGHLTGSLTIPTPDGGGLNGKFAVDSAALDAHIGVDLRDLDVLTVLNPEIVEIRGHIGGNMTISGSPQQPSLQGRLALEAESLVLDTPNIELKKLSAALVGRGRSALSLTGHAESGDGPLSLEGVVDWSAAQPSVAAHLVGERFLASNSELATVRISPDLRVTLRERQLSVDGRIDVPLAHLNAKELESNGRISPSGDEFVVGEDDEEPAIVVTSDVRLSLGDDVRFTGYGLKTRIGGKLRTQSRSGGVATASGELQLLEGRYKAYGQDLVIERGRLLFSGGAITEPGLDFRAYRQARTDIRAGVQVRGSLRAPEFTLYSDPPMRETDQLSYLVLGRAAEAQSESDQAALNNAALALGLQGGDFLAQKVKGRLGIDEVKIGAQPGESADQAALILGKYLTPDLYISYGIGLFEPTYEFRMQYRIAERWLLQTESGVESGGDIFYTIER